MNASMIVALILLLGFSYWGNRKVDAFAIQLKLACPRIWADVLEADRPSIASIEQQHRFKDYLTAGNFSELPIEMHGLATQASIIFKLMRRLAYGWVALGMLILFFEIVI